MMSRPLTNSCVRSFKVREHACIGISPFNSYFSEEMILKLVRWATSNFKSHHLFVPDKPASYTLEALGYDKKKADKKARRQANYLHNKIKRAYDKLDIIGCEYERSILNWEKLENSDSYAEVFKNVTNLYENDEEFRTDCRAASRWVLQRKIDDKKLCEESIDKACQYLIAEIPLFIDSRRIVGVSNSVFCYHQTIEFLDKLFSGVYQCKPEAGQGFVVIEPKNVERDILIPESTVRLPFKSVPLSQS
jgi:cyclo(L-tyrosyl-L-tyrosyl) synthase